MPGKPSSDDLRWAVVRMVSCGYTTESIESLLGVSASTIRRIMSIFHTSGGTRVSLDITGRDARGRPQALSYREIWYLCDRVSNNPATYLDELQAELSEACGAQISQATVWRTLKQCGFTMKKLDRRALERCDQKRLDYQYAVSEYPPDYLCFVDESSCDRRTTYRGFGWALSGKRAFQKAFFVRGQRYSVLPALSISGIEALSIVQGSFTAETYREFIELTLGFMNPFPGPKSVLVMDNARIHRDQETLDMITNRGMRYVFLPPYSPDYNPIELAFSAIKYRIRRDGDWMRLALQIDGDDTEVRAKLYEHVFATTESDARGWFRHCGYI